MFDRLRRKTNAQRKPADSESVISAPATENAQQVNFYGRQLTFERESMALEMGQPPAYLTRVDVVLMRCVAPVHQPGEDQVKECGGVIQMYVNFRPVAYICPWCFGIYIYPDPKSELPGDADGELIYQASDSLFYYGLYAEHPAREHLHGTILRATKGNGLLVAHPIKPNSWTDSEMPLGRFLFAPASVPEQDLRKMERSARQISFSIVERAAQYYEQGDNMTVVALADRATAIDPTFAIPYRLIGDALDELDCSEAAIDYYGKALAIDPNQSEVVGNMANAFAKLGRGQDAEHYFREALRISPNSAEARAGLAYQLLNRGLVDDAAHELSAACRLKPDSPEYAFNLGSTYFRAGHYQEALSAFRESMRLAPLDPDVHHAIGEVMFATGRWSEAVTAWRTGARFGSTASQKRLREIDA